MDIYQKMPRTALQFRLFVLPLQSCYRYHPAFDEYCQEVFIFHRFYNAWGLYLTRGCHGNAQAINHIDSNTRLSNCLSASGQNSTYLYTYIYIYTRQPLLAKGIKAACFDAVRFLTIIGHAFSYQASAVVLL